MFLHQISAYAIQKRQSHTKRLSPMQNQKFELSVIYVIPITDNMDHNVYFCSQ